MAIRPKHQIDHELYFAQIGEPWPLVVTFKEGDTSDDWFPTSGTITITHAGNGALTTPVTAASMTLSGNTLSYTLAANSLTVPERNLKAVLTFTDGTDTWSTVVHFDSVRYSPRIPATIDDVAMAIPQVGSLYTPEDPDGQGALAEAWQRVLSDITRKGAYPQFAIDTAQLYLGHLYRTRFALYRRAVREQGDELDVQAQMWLADYDEWLATLKLDLDKNEDGVLSLDETGVTLNVVDFGRSVK